jgi:hypothetical protein
MSRQAYEVSDWLLKPEAVQLTAQPPSFSVGRPEENLTSVVPSIVGAQDYLQGATDSGWIALQQIIDDTVSLGQTLFIARCDGGRAR